MIDDEQQGQIDDEAANGPEETAPDPGVPQSDKDTPKNDPVPE